MADTAGVDAVEGSVRAADNCLDFVRYSGEPGVGAPATNDLQYVPFGRDSATYAVTRTTSVPRELSTARLRAIYSCQDTAVHPLLPPKGSQLRALWLSMLSISEPQIDHDCTCAGTVARDNDASTLDNTSIVPFSTAQYICQLVRERKADTRANAGLGVITGQTGGTGAPIVASADPMYGSMAAAVQLGSDLPAAFTFVQMQRVYRCLTTTIAGIPVTPALPPKNTVLRGYWLNKMGIWEEDITNGDYPCLRTLSAAANDLRALPNNTLMPVTISEYVKQILGQSTDQRGTAALVPMGSDDGADPAPIVPNLDYSPALVHTVGVGVPRAKLATSPWREVFAGSASLVCQQRATIEAFGFAAMPDGTCGGGTDTGQDNPSDRRLAGVGSTTTAAVMRSLGDAVRLDGAPVLASFDSSGKTPVATKPGCTSYRPVNDIQGIAQLNADHQCLDYVRVSNIDTAAMPGGASLVFAPFALDSITYTVAAGGTVPRTMTKAQLQSAYRCTTAGVTPLLPGAGSQLRVDWLRYLGLTEAQISAATCVRSTDAGGAPIIENDGRVLTPDAIVPFSTASYVAQAGTTAPDRRGRAVPGKVSDPAGPGPVRANTGAYPDGVTFAVRGDIAMPRRLSSSQLYAIYTCADTRFTPTLPASGELDKAFAALLSFATLPASDPQPCGSVQRGSSTPASATQVSFRAQVPEDDGGVVGSGSTLTAWHGNCKVTGTFSNATDSSQMVIRATASGPRCRVLINARYFDQATGETLDPDFREIDFANGGSTTLLHSPGTQVYQIDGRSRLIGHYLRDVNIGVTDVSAGAPSGSSSASIVGAGAPSVYGVELHSPGGQNSVEVQWQKGVDRKAFRIMRRDVLTESSYRVIADLENDPFDGEDTMTFKDETTELLHQYAYKVASLWPLGEIVGEPSVELRITPSSAQRVKHYVALGDSYSSGEGGENYFGGDGSGCHRSRGSYAMRLTDPFDRDYSQSPYPSAVALSQLATDGKARVDVIACSGALARNVIADLGPIAPIPYGNLTISGRPGSWRQSEMEPWQSLYRTGRPTAPCCTSRRPRRGTSPAPR
nr:hypothetical protein GCM10020063_008150 [Dactylosporangium thailandense]